MSARARATVRKGLRDETDPTGCNGSNSFSSLSAALAVPIRSSAISQHQRWLVVFGCRFGNFSVANKCHSSLLHLSICLMHIYFSPRYERLCGSSRYTFFSRIIVLFSVRAHRHEKNVRYVESNIIRSKGTEIKGAPKWDNGVAGKSEGQFLIIFFFIVELWLLHGFTGPEWEILNERLSVGDMRYCGGWIGWKGCRHTSNSIVEWLFIPGMTETDPSAWLTNFFVFLFLSKRKFGNLVGCFINLYDPFWPIFQHRHH